MNVSFAVLHNCDYNLEEIDFSSLGVEIFNNLSEKHEEYVRSLSTEDSFGLNFYEFQRLEEENELEEAFYIISPIDVTNENYYKKILDCFHFLMICNPSSLHIIREIFFEVHEGKISRLFSRIHSRRSTDQYPSDNFLIDSEQLEHIRKLQAKFLRSKEKKYISTAIESYVSSFDMNYYSMQYLSLLMSLESLVNGPIELSYRLKRLVAIICGKDNTTCSNIFNNISKTYKVRSKLVHGESYELNDIHNHIPYLTALVSRMLIELIVIGFNKKDHLNSKINSLGFGQKSKITDNYEELIPDRSIYSLALNHRL